MSRVRNRARFLDRSFPIWHMGQGPLYAFDVDLVPRCGACGEPLGIVEASTNPDHPNGPQRRLAEMAVPVLPFYFVELEGEVGECPTCHGPAGEDLRVVDPKAYLAWERQLRRVHRCTTSAT